jgi:biopolymer transport protein ExbB
MTEFGILQAFHTWHGAVITTTLIALSVYLTSIIIMRAMFFRQINQDSQKLLSDVHRALSANDMKTLDGFKGHRESDPPLKIVLGVSLTHAELPAHELSELLGVTRMRQTQRISKGLPIFATLATIAPFIGLLGTVIGIVESFNSLASTGAAGPNVVAAGVAEALWATAAGLVVAIPAVVAHNIFRSKVRSVVTDMEVVSKEIPILAKVDNRLKKLKVAV